MDNNIIYELQELSKQMHIYEKINEENMYFTNHKYIGHNEEIPNNGKIVENIYELIPTRINYSDILIKNGIQIPKIPKNPMECISIDLSKININNVNNSNNSTLNKLIIDNSWNVIDIITKCPPRSWIHAFDHAINELYHVNKELIEREKKGERIIPLKKDIFKCFELCPFEKIKVIIVGNYPYYTIRNGIYDANGLSFSTNKGMSITKTIQNIYTVLTKTVPSFVHPGHGDLSRWAEQGVLLLNKSLTTKEGIPNGHGSIWDGFITKILQKIQEYNPSVIFLLWGEQAQSLTKIITSRNILMTTHPSPLSAYQGFLHCNHFNEVNEILLREKKSPINWNLI